MDYSDLMVWKDFLELKNIILEENLTIKLKNSHDNFSGEKNFHGFEIFC
jgi:hypothetical protein